MTVYREDWPWAVEDCTLLTKIATENWDSLYEDHPIEHHNDPTFNKWVDYTKFKETSAWTLISTISDKILTAANEADHPWRDSYDWVCRGITRWDPGTLMEAHVDAPTGWDERDLAALLYLNGGFEGGVLQFPKLDLEIVPQAGVFIMFPSAEDEYIHNVTQVDSLTSDNIPRYTFSCWFTKNEIH